MTNASVKNQIVSSSLVAVLSVAMSFGAFASIVHAQEADFGGDGCILCGDATYNSEYVPSYDSEYVPSYDSEYVPSYDSEYVPSYDSEYTPSYDSAINDYGYNDYGYDSGYSDYGYGNYGYSSYSTPSYVSSLPVFNSYGYSIPSISKPISVTAPSTPVVITQPSQNTNITNTNVNTNVNTNINNSINNSFNTTPNVATVAAVTPVVTTPVQYPVQYVYQQPIVYQTPTYIPTQSYIPTPAPVLLGCSITASPSSIQNGQPTYLSWTSTGATSAWLSDSIGVVAPSGTLIARPAVSTTYTLTVTGFGGTRTCSTPVTVTGTTVSLTQIPYTGFDFGTVGNAIYWAALALFALAGGYLVVYYRGGAASFAGNIASRSNVVSSSFVAAPMKFAKKEVAETPSRSSSAFEYLPVASSAPKAQDAMKLVRSIDGSQPRIVIARN